MERMVEISEDYNTCCIKVKAPFSSIFNRKAKKLNGKWDNSTRTWKFSSKNLHRVKELCLETYGDDGNGYEPITLQVNLSQGSFKRGNTICIGGIQLCNRPYKNNPVMLSKNVIVVKGDFLSWGGSCNYPEVTWDDKEELILEVEKFPKSILDNLDEEDKIGITIVEDERTENREFLLKEKERLLIRIAEIDKLLEDM